MLRVARRPGGCRASITGACSASALDLSPLALDAPIPVVGDSRLLKLKTIFLFFNCVSTFMIFNDNFLFFYLQMFFLLLRHFLVVPI